MSKSFVIVGGGISGLATAVALQRRGHTVQVLEERTDTIPRSAEQASQREVPPTGAAISIWPNALAALDEIGVGSAVRSAGGSVTAGSIRWHDGRWLRRPDLDRMTRALGEPLVVLRRSDLMAVLTGALAPGTIEFGVAVTDVAMTAAGIEVECSDGRARAASALVGADGTRSVVARWINGPLRDRYAGYTAWRGIAGIGMDAALAGETLGPGAELGHVPLGPDSTYWFATERVAEGQQNAGGELDYIQDRFSSWPDPIPALMAATDSDAVIRTDLYDREPARRWCRGSVVIVGDAAHPMRPHLGQGGCQGIEDAVVLADLLGDGSDVVAAFALFSDVRMRRVRPIVRESKRIGQVLNLRPDWLSSAAARASAWVPESVLIRHLATIASRDAFRDSAHR